MKYLIFDCSPIDKPKDYKAPFTDTFAWPRLMHLSWIVLDKDFKPKEDFDCIIDPEGFKLTKTIQKRVKIDDEDIVKKSVIIRCSEKNVSVSCKKVRTTVKYPTEEEVINGLRSQNCTLSVFSRDTLQLIMLEQM